MAEKALQIALENAYLDSETIKALRLTCKRTKAAADAKVKEFTLRLDEQQDSEAVKRSGLLNCIRKLHIYIDLRALDDAPPINPQQISRAVGLLHLAVDVCSKSLEVLDVTVYASPGECYACGSILGRSTWECLQELSMTHPYHVAMPAPGFLSGILARPGRLPALKSLGYSDASAVDIASLDSSALVGNLTSLSLEWCHYGINTAPATVAAMRNLLQQATNLESLRLKSSTFAFFDSEQLISLKSLHLNSLVLLSERGTVDFAPALARPWPTLETLCIENAALKTVDVVRIFEAEDTLPLLKKLTIKSSSVNIAVLNNFRRPHLEHFGLRQCRNEFILFYRFIQLMKNDTCVFPTLRELHVEFMGSNGADDMAIETISEFLSYPCMAELETLTIQNINIATGGIVLLYDVENHCRKLKHLDLRNNNLGRPTVALLLGYGKTGAWPKLQKLGILGENIYDRNPCRRESKLEDPPQEDVQTTLRRAWPGLICY